MLSFVHMHINNHLTKHFYLCDFFLANFSCKQRCYRNYWKMGDFNFGEVMVAFNFEKNICSCGNRKKCDWLRWDEKWGGEWKSDTNHCKEMKSTANIRTEKISNVHIQTSHLQCNDDHDQHKYMWVFLFCVFSFF